MMHSIQLTTHVRAFRAFICSVRNNVRVILKRPFYVTVSPVCCQNRAFWRAQLGKIAQNAHYGYRKCGA